MSIASKKLSLLIPVYNGAPYLTSTFQELETFLDEAPFLHEVIFINDGSVDSTKEMLETFKQTSGRDAVSVVHLSTNKGKGFALQQGIRHVQDDVSHVAFTDVELPYGLAVLKTMLEQDAHMVVGDRTQNTPATQYSRYRQFFTRLFRLLLPRLVRQIPDTQSGVKLFDLSTAKNLFSHIHTSGWVFDIELFLIALQQQLSVNTVPVQVKPSCVKGKGGITFLKHSHKIVKDLVHVHYCHMVGKYKK